MVVLITNVTDGPGKKPREVRVYNKRIAPGTQMRVDARYVDEKVRKLEEAGFIVIGQVPAWYADYSDRRQKRNLSSEQVKEKLKAKKDYDDRKAARAEQASKKPTVPSAGKSSVTVTSSVEVPEDDLSATPKEHKEPKRKKRR